MQKERKKENFVKKKKNKKMKMEKLNKLLIVIIKYLKQYKMGMSKLNMWKKMNICLQENIMMNSNMFFSIFKNNNISQNNKKMRILISINKMKVIRK